MTGRIRSEVCRFVAVQYGGGNVRAVFGRRGTQNHPRRRRPGIGTVMWIRIQLFSIISDFWLSGRIVGILNNRISGIQPVSVFYREKKIERKN